MEQTLLRTRAKKTRIIFAKDLSFYKLVWCFIIGSIIGTLYEEILTFLKYGVWENRSSVIIGPFNPLYGVGFIIALVLFNEVNNPAKLLLFASLFGGAFEYTFSWAQEFFTGSISWNYKDLPLNINGRTTVLYSLFWGLYIFGAIKLLYPFLSKWIERIPYSPGVIITRILIVFLSINMLVSYSMLIRQGARAKGIEPYTPLGEYYDRVFTDEYIADLFPNMVPIKGDNNE